MKLSLFLTGLQQAMGLIAPADPEIVVELGGETRPLGGCSGRMRPDGTVVLTFYAAPPESGPDNRSYRQPHESGAPVDLCCVGCFKPFPREQAHQHVDSEGRVRRPLCPACFLALEET